MHRKLKEIQTKFAEADAKEAREKMGSLQQKIDNLELDKNKAK